jgi:hypothetical protein
LLRRLEGKAQCVVALQKRLSVIHPACDVTQIDTSERVDRASVAAYADDIWEAGGKNCNVGLFGQSLLLG